MKPFTKSLCWPRLWCSGWSLCSRMPWDLNNALWFRVCGFNLQLSWLCLSFYQPVVALVWHDWFPKTFLKVLIVPPVFAEVSVTHIITDVWLTTDSSQMASVWMFFCAHPSSNHYTELKEGNPPASSPVTSPVTWCTLALFHSHAWAKWSLQFYPLAWLSFVSAVTGGSIRQLRPCQQSFDWHLLGFNTVRLWGNNWSLHSDHSMWYLKLMPANLHSCLIGFFSICGSRFTGLISDWLRVVKMPSHWLLSWWRTNKGAFLHIYINCRHTF